MSTFAGSSQNAPLPRGQETTHHGKMGFLKDLWTRMGQNDFAGLSAEMAYNWMMALVPLFIFLFSLFGMISSHGDTFNQLMENLRRLIPGDAYTLVYGTITDLTQHSSGGLAVIGLITALWTSSNGAVVVEKGLNRAYRCVDEHRNFIQQRITALMIVLGMGIIIVVCSNLLIFGGMIIDTIQNFLHPSGFMLTLFGMIRWVLPLVSLVVISMFIYTIGPDRRKKDAWKETWPGALTFVGLWVIISVLFSVYVSHMGNYSRVYGPMGAIIILMVWLYLTSYALLIGGQVNAMRTGCDEGDLQSPPKPKTP